MAEALYRKYRPQVFEDVVGQEPIERTLKNAISQDKVSHAYLLCGPRGTGKTTTARLLAKALMCQKGPTPDPDGTCEDCLLIADGVHPDVYELDAASRTGVENVREEIISRVHFAPTRGQYKVYIIDEVHMLSTAAFNALLKTLEEPPSHVVFVLCTTDPQKVPETIHSRCQRFDFHRISPESMVARLGAICIAEEVEFEGEALDLIAQRADGGLRDALTSLEQIIAFENGKVTLAGAERLLGAVDSNDLAEIMALIGQRDIAGCFRWTAAFVETGADLAQFVRDMADHVRNLYVMALVGDEADLEVSESVRRELATELSWFGEDRASRLLGVLGDLMAELKTTSNPRLAFEISLTRMVRPDSDLTLEGLAERVEALEGGYSAVAHVLPGAHSARISTVSTEVSAAASATAFAEAAAVVSQAVGAAANAASTHEEHRDEPCDTSPIAVGSQEGVDALSAKKVGSDAGVEGETSGMQHWVDAPDISADDFVSASADQSAVNTGTRPHAQSISAQDEFASNSKATTPDVSGIDTAAPASTSASSPLANPAALQRIWQTALSEVKKKKQAYGVLFMSSKALFDTGLGAIRIVFPAEASFAFNAVQKPDVQDALTQALERAAGQPVVYQFERDGQLVAATATRVESTNEQPVSQPEPAPRVEAIQGETVAAKPAAVPNPSEQVPYEDVPWEQGPFDQVPYDDQTYNQVPYEEFDAPSDSTSISTTATFRAQPMPEQTSVSERDAAALQDSASNDDAAALQEPASDNDAAALQAMLQASFGEGVVFSEASE